MTEAQNAVRQHEHKATWFTIEEAKKQVIDTTVPRNIPLNFSKPSS